LPNSVSEEKSIGRDEESTTPHEKEKTLHVSRLSGFWKGSGKKNRVVGEATKKITRGRGFGPTGPGDRASTLKISGQPMLEKEEMKEGKERALRPPRGEKGKRRKRTERKVHAPLQTFRVVEGEKDRWGGFVSPSTPSKQRKKGGLVEHGAKPQCRECRLTIGGGGGGRNSRNVKNSR